jgi:hypothetical protein
MMQYRIVSGYDWSAVVREVNELYSQGWKPQGGISVTMTENYTQYYAQAMVREKVSSVSENRE